MEDKDFIITWIAFASHAIVDRHWAAGNVPYDEALKFSICSFMTCHYLTVSQPLSSFFN